MIESHDTFRLSEALRELQHVLVIAWNFPLSLAIDRSCWTVGESQNHEGTNIF